MSADFDYTVRIQDAIRYTIEPGQSNFSPIESPWPIFEVDGFEIAARLDSSCWWSEEDWNYDKDRNDWNKLRGITWFFSGNACHSAMIAWRPGALRNVFDIAPYTNAKCGQWEAGQPVQVYAGEVFYALCVANRRNIHYEIMSYGTEKQDSHGWRRPWPWICREVGTWVGGENNSPGEYGGKATQRMEMEIATKYHR